MADEKEHKKKSEEESINANESPKLARTGDQEADTGRNRNTKRGRDDKPLEGDEVEL